jgi:hypothetical protein
MASRYERICLIENLHNNPEVNVELLAGALLRDNLENALKCQLKFRVTGKNAAHRVSVSISCFNENGIRIDQKIYIYDNGPYVSETDYGTDVLIEIVPETVCTQVAVHSATFDANVQLAIRNCTPAKLFESGTVFVGRLMEDGLIYFDESPERGQTCIKELPRGINVLEFMNVNQVKTRVTVDISADSAMAVAFNYKMKCYEVSVETPATLKILTNK